MLLLVLDFYFYLDYITKNKANEIRKKIPTVGLRKVFMYFYLKHVKL